MTENQVYREDEKTKPNTPIEFEQITIKVPKQAMTYLRFRAQKDKDTVEAQIEYALLDSVRAQIDLFGEEFAVYAAGLGPVFYELLGDKSFKPETEVKQTE